LHNDTAILLRHRIKKEDSDREDFLGVVSGLRHRATTVASDEPVVLLTLLRLPHKDEPSMADIYRPCRDIPQDIIFANSPRLQLDGFRWAPSTFLIRWSHPSGKSNRSGVVTSREFQLQKDCVLPGNEALEIYDNTERPAPQRYVVIEGGQPRYFFMQRYEIEPTKSLGATAIILQEPITSSILKRSFGILVSNVKIEYDLSGNVSIAYGCYELQVVLARWSEESYKFRIKSVNVWVFEL
jgi:hypothetical protein